MKLLKAIFFLMFLVGIAINSAGAALLALLWVGIVDRSTKAFDKCAAMQYTQDNPQLIRDTHDCLHAHECECSTSRF